MRHYDILPEKNRPFSPAGFNMQPGRPQRQANERERIVFLRAGDMM
jgi:hypothetical protein